MNKQHAHTHPCPPALRILPKPQKLSPDELEMISAHRRIEITIQQSPMFTRLSKKAKTNIAFLLMWSMIAIHHGESISDVAEWIAGQGK